VILVNEERPWHIPRRMHYFICSLDMAGGSRSLGLPLEFVQNIGFGTILCNIYAPWVILAYPVSYYRNRRIVNDIKGNAQTEGPTSNDSNNAIIELEGEKKVIPTLLQCIRMDTPLHRICAIVFW